MDLPLAVSCATQRKGVSGGVAALNIAGELVGNALVGKFYPVHFNSIMTCKIHQCRFAVPKCPFRCRWLQCGRSELGGLCVQSGLVEVGWHNR